MWHALTSTQSFPLKFVSMSLTVLRTISLLAVPSSRIHFPRLPVGCRPVEKKGGWFVRSAGGSWNTFYNSEWCRLGVVNLRTQSVKYDRKMGGKSWNWLSWKVKPNNLRDCVQKLSWTPGMAHIHKIVMPKIKEKHSPPFTCPNLLCELVTKLFMKNVRFTNLPPVQVDSAEVSIVSKE